MKSPALPRLRRSLRTLQLLRNQVGAESRPFSARGKKDVAVPAGGALSCSKWECSKTAAVYYEQCYLGRRGWTEISVATEDDARVREGDGIEVIAPAGTGAEFWHFEYPSSSSSLLRGPKVSRG